jgi:2-amino-1-hydroxyethylphosphonate dioxygenase (glycine-forming)
LSYKHKFPSGIGVIKRCGDKKQNKMTAIEKTADIIIKHYEQHGNDAYFGESVTQLQHASQAYEAAVNEGFDADVQVAAFLHDFGHLITDAEPMGNLGVLNHEQIGADWLRKHGFSDKVCRLIAAHVNAKRYLVAVDEAYWRNLSEASRQTLAYQGGKMTAAEAARFEDDPYFLLYIRMRLWDESAKDPSVSALDLSVFRAKIIEHLTHVLDSPI